MRAGLNSRTIGVPATRRAGSLFSVAHFQWHDRGAEMKTKQWRGNDYAAVIVGLLFVIAILFSFRINDWVMHTFVWD
jgi:hypothetical protein